MSLRPFVHVEVASAQFSSLCTIDPFTYVDCCRLRRNMNFGILLRKFSLALHHCRKLFHRLRRNI